ncbi:MAG: fluoride efflux transporter CrcB [Chlorobi bacterium]|nr:fluoride efflux transporter CrcB [Chlorobiota bacterium]
MILKVLLISIGGSIGAVFRYLIFVLFEKSTTSTFPWPTLVINITGAFVIGFLWGWFDRLYVAPGIRMLIFIGILGSFTTFSTFAFDVFSLVHDGQIKNVIFYILGTNILGIGLAFVGFYITRLIS